MAGLPELETVATATNDIIDNIYRRVRDGNITISNIIHITKDIMTIVEEFKGLTGIEKKQITIDTLTLLIFNHGGEFKNELSTLTRFLIPEAIDVIISATRGNLLINMAESIETVSKCCWVV